MVVYIWFGCMKKECLVWQFWRGGLQMMERRKFTNKTCITSNNFLQTQGHKLSSAFFVVLSFEVGVKLLYRDVTKIVLFSFLQIHYTSAFLFLISYYIYICCENDISLYMPDICQLCNCDFCSCWLESSLLKTQTLPLKWYRFKDMKVI